MILYTGIKPLDMAMQGIRGQPENVIFLIITVMFGVIKAKIMFKLHVCITIQTIMSILIENSSTHHRKWD